MTFPLAQLPADLIASIVQSSHGNFCIIDLWKCGNRNLNAKLSQGITRLDLENLGSPFHPRTHIPTLISQLRALRSFSIVSDVLLDDVTPIAQLPTSLESLSLDLPIPRKSVFASTSGDPAVLNPDFLDLKSLFPRLLSLSLGVKSFRPSKLSCLPTSLTRLSLATGLVFRVGKPLMALLPRGLTDLDCTVINNVHEFDYDDPAWEADWALAPPNLTRISSITCYTPDKLQWLPRTLIECELPLRWTPACAFTIPSLTVMSLYHGFEPHYFQQSGNNCIEMLPRTLTELTVNSPESLASCFPNGRKLRRELAPKPTKESAFASLRARYSANAPAANGPKLREEPTLIGKGVTPQQEADLKLLRAAWPPLLKVLRLSVAGEMTPAEVLMLPRTLTSLQLGDNNDGEYSPRPKLICFPRAFNAEWLPPALTLLDISSLWQACELDLANDLPASITILSSKPRTWSTGSRRWHAPQLAHLASITDLCIEVADYVALYTGNNHLIDWSLPPSLTRFHTGYMKYDWLKLIPRTVRDLALVVPPPAEGSKADPFVDLPSELETLWIECSEEFRSQAFPARSFSTLKHLVNLHSELMTFPSAVFRSLPAKSMRRLQLGLRDLSEKDAAFIPKKLRLLVLKGITLSQKPWIGKYWPIGASQSLEFEDTSLVEMVRSRAHEIYE